MELSEDCAFICQENNDLKEQKEKLEKKIVEMERKMDDPESRSKRNNQIVHGLYRVDMETSEDCEAALKDLIRDKLELADDVQLDTEHRLNAKPSFPMEARCTFFKDKVNIVKAKNKLQESDVFTEDDCCFRVRDEKRKLVAHLKKVRSESGRVTVVFDPTFIEGKKITVDDTDNPKELK